MVGPTFYFHVGFPPSKSEKHGLAWPYRWECVCLWLAKFLLLTGSICKLGTHSVENRGNFYKHSWDQGSPSNYVSTSLFTSQAALNQALGY